WWCFSQGSKPREIEKRKEVEARSEDMHRRYADKDAELRAKPVNAKHQIYGARPGDPTLGRERVPAKTAPSQTLRNAKDCGEYRQAAGAAEKVLKVHSEYRQYPLQYCGKAGQGHKNFEKISKSPVSHKPIN